MWERGGPHVGLLVGLTGAARMLPYVALSWATGRLADRFRRDRIVRGTLVARLALLVVVAVAARRPAAWRRGGRGAGGGGGHPGLPGPRGRDARDRRRPARRATDLLVTIEVASFVVGPALGGLLLAAGDPASGRRGRSAC